MASAGSGKKYGLIIKKKNASLKIPSVFNESSSEDEGTGGGGGGGGIKSGALWRENKKNASQMESREVVQKALRENPDVFDYDGVYDKMQEDKKKADPRLAVKDLNSKYIGQLKKVAERRKMEQDIIYERKVQREIEQEGKDSEEKDTFLTSAYRKKLEERKLLEEELKLAAHKEEMDDVSKQKDMSRFHRAVLNQITADGKSSDTCQSTQAPHDMHTMKDVSQDSEDNTTPQGRLKSKDDRGMSRPDEGHKRRRDSLTVEMESSSQEKEERAEDSDENSAPSRHDSGTNQQGEREVTPDVESDHVLSDERSEEEIKTQDVPLATETSPDLPPVMDKATRRKMVSSKRSTQDSLSSARERYLARKKAKLSTPVISTDN